MELLAMKHTQRREPVPLEVMREQIAAYSAGVRGEALVDLTRRLFPVDAFEDWREWFTTPGRPLPSVGRRLIRRWFR